MEDTLEFPAALDQRLAALRALSDELSAACTAILGRDAARLEEHTAREKQLLGDLVRVETQLQKLSHDPSFSAAFPECRQGRWQEHQQEVQNALRRLRHLSRVHQALLARASRTVGALLCTIPGTTTLTYEPPRASILTGRK